jgi:hypothetical protein
MPVLDGLVAVGNAGLKIHQAFLRVFFRASLQVCGITSILVLNLSHQHRLSQVLRFISQEVISFPPAGYGGPLCQNQHPSSVIARTRKSTNKA